MCLAGRKKDTARELAEVQSRLDKLVPRVDEATNDVREADRKVRSATQSFETLKKSMSGGGTGSGTSRRVAVFGQSAMKIYAAIQREKGWNSTPVGKWHHIFLLRLCLLRFSFLVALVCCISSFDAYNMVGDP
jgi:hypothetical protein